MFVFLFGLSVDKNVVNEVDHAVDSFKTFTDCILKYFRCARYAKIESFIAQESQMGAKGSDVPRFGRDLELFVTLVEIEFSLYSCICLSISTQTLILPGDLGLGATTIGDTQGVGPSTLSMIPSSSSFCSCSSSCFRTWNGTCR